MRANTLDELTCNDPAGAFAHLLWLHGPEALGLRRFDMRDLAIDEVGRAFFPDHEPPYFTLPEASETWDNGHAKTPPTPRGIGSDRAGGAT